MGYNAPALPSPLYRHGGLPWPLLRALGPAAKEGTCPPSHLLGFWVPPTSFGRMGLGDLVRPAHVGCCTPLWSMGAKRSGGSHFRTFQNLLESSRYPAEKFPKPWKPLSLCPVWLHRIGLRIGNLELASPILAFGWSWYWVLEFRTNSESFFPTVLDHAREYGGRGLGIVRNRTRPA